MFSRLSRAFVDFYKHEDGLTKVECAAMLGFLVAGCVIALTLGGTPTDAQSRSSTFTVTFKEPTGRTSRVAKDTKSWDSSKGRDQKVMDARNTSNADGGAQANDVDLAGRKSDKDTDAMKESQPGHVPAATDIEDDDNMRETEKTMSEDEARQALVGLLKTHPSSFAVSVQTIRTASVVHKADHIEIDLFRCYLKSKRFTYGTLRAGQPADQTSGVFYQVQNGEWTGRITAVTRR
jgi:hypothetical protein